MQYLLDTYNIVHAADGLGGALSDMTVRKLCQFISAAPAGLRCTLVLDGRAKPDEPSENEFPDIHLVYSGAGVSADAVIAQRVERAKSRKSLTIVTNDRAVALHARRHFAHAMSCETFLRRLTGTARAAGTPLPARKTTGTRESAHWLKEFGFATPAAPDATAAQPHTNVPSPADATAKSAAPPPSPKKSTGHGDLDAFDIEKLLGPPGEI